MRPGGRGGNIFGRRKSLWPGAAFGYGAPAMTGSDPDTAPSDFTPPEFGPAGETTHFGFRAVPRDEKAGLVRQVFDSVAGRYDVMNDLMSAGVHRLWKDALVSWLQPRADWRVLDLAGGTGDIAFRIKAAAPGARIAVADINEAMLARGRDRALDRGLLDLDWLVADAEKLPVASGSLDALTIAFGIRNVTDIPAALAEVRRVLKPGGRFLCLEFSRLRIAPLVPLYEAWSFRALPAIGKAVAGDEDSYRYLAESIRRFPDQATFAGMISAAGLGLVKVRDLSGGIAALHSAWRL